MKQSGLPYRLGGMLLALALSQGAAHAMGGGAAPKAADDGGATPPTKMMGGGLASPL